jgi:nucleotide-binding universal stress UspA family protein
MPAIVVGVDGSRPSDEALRFAVDEARLRGCTLRVISAWSIPAAMYGDGGMLPEMDTSVFERTAQATLDAATALVRERAPELALDARAECGPPASVLVDAAADAAMIVVGLRGRGGFRSLLLGSVSHQLASHAPCPVTIVRSTEHDAA